MNQNYTGEYSFAYGVIPNGEYVAKGVGVVDGFSVNTSPGGLFWNDPISEPVGDANKKLADDSSAAVVEDEQSSTGICGGDVGTAVESVDGLSGRSTNCCNITLHSGFDKNATAASGCILISIERIVRAHDSMLWFSETFNLDEPLFVGEPRDGDDVDP
jgi:hypothetical protein